MADKRTLTKPEKYILDLIQDAYGDENNEDEVFFSDEDEAVIFIKSNKKTSLGMVVLTNLAEWLEDGTISSVEELKHDWLQVNDT